MFEAAGAAEIEAREAVLEQGCGADTELRVLVEGMIGADSEAHEILDHPFSPTDAEGANLQETFESGALIGPYRIVRELGAGGMGTVYLADRADGSTPDLYALPRLPPSLVNHSVYMAEGLIWTRVVSSPLVRRRVGWQIVAGGFNEILRPEKIKLL